MQVGEKRGAITRLMISPLVFLFFFRSLARRRSPLTVREPGTG